MSEEYGPDFITVTDEEGNDIELELVDALEHEGNTYMDTDEELEKIYALFMERFYSDEDEDE